MIVAHEEAWDRRDVRSACLFAGMGSAAFGYGIGPGATQTDELPWANLNQVSIAFDKDVSVHAADLAVRGSSGLAYAVSGYAYDAASHTGTWTLAQALAPAAVGGERITLTLDADAGVSADGLALDGEFAAGAALPSGNGSPGGDFLFDLSALPGDADRSGRINALDLGFLKQRLNTVPVDRPAPGGYSPFGDFDAGARINALDLGLAKQRLNSRLPATPLPASLFSDRPVIDDKSAAASRSCSADGKAAARHVGPGD